MRVRPPTSNERVNRFVHAFDAVSVTIAAPLAIVLRDPTMFLGVRSVTTFIYCVAGAAAGVFSLFVFHIGRSLGNHNSSKELRSVIVASLATAGATSLLIFSFDRLEFIPRSVPLTQALILNTLLLGGRVVAIKRSSFGGFNATNYKLNSEHALIVGANDFTVSYLKMLDAFNVDRTNFVAILDDNPCWYGRSLLGHPIIAPPRALSRIINEYRVHGVEIDRLVISANRPELDSSQWKELTDTCRGENIHLEFLSDILGFDLDEPNYKVPSEEKGIAPATAYSILKRVFDFSISIAIAVALLPVILIVALGIVVDMGRPILFWQKRIGYQGRPFLIYKFRTLHPPFDRNGNFVDESRRVSRLGAFLRRTRLDETPQLWNVLTGDMSFVGPRPLLPIDQPAVTKVRLSVTPGITGWAQVNGGRRVGAEEKAALDQWYVENASFRLDMRIIWRTIGIVFFGDGFGAGQIRSRDPIGYHN